MADVLLLNGPNLNLLGERETAVYGTTTLEQIVMDTKELVEQAQLSFFALQTNYEGALIDCIQQQKKARFILLNPGGLTHTSVALRDALSARSTPFIEIHLSNVYAREPFRAKSFLSDKAVGVISGFGPLSYHLAAQAAVHFLRTNEKIR